MHDVYPYTAFSTYSDLLFPAWVLADGPEAFAARVADADRITDRSQYTDPHHYSEGVVHVWVGGTAVLRAEEMTGARPGRFLERGRQ